MGNSNFSQLGDDGVQRWLQSRGEPYIDGVYARSSHAHSLYLNTLAERGLVGFGMLLALLGAFAVSLVRGIPRRRDPALHWLLWCGAASAFVTTVGIGLVNTTPTTKPGLFGHVADRRLGRLSPPRAQPGCRPKPPSWDEGQP
jgi:O-antigen ligase